MDKLVCPCSCGTAGIFRGKMFFRLFLLFTLLPVIELAILIKVGTVIGTLNTITLVIGTAVVGSFMVRKEGIGVIYRFQRNMREGIFPAEELIDGAMVLIAGALLVTPGFVTDIIGFLLVFPVSRRRIKILVRRHIEKKISSSINIHMRRF
ncbi:MAG: FxsA family protein [Nitrospinota bacterium]